MRDPQSRRAESAKELLTKFQLKVSRVRAARAAPPSIRGSMRLSWRVIIDVIAPALITCWIAYFAYDAVVGATGYRVLHTLRAETATRSAELARLTAERRRLEQIARQLNPRSLDPDMVDEKIRAVLGYVEEGDLVIPRDQLDEIIRQDRRASP